MDWYNVGYVLFVITVFVIAGLGIYMLPWTDRELKETTKACREARKHIRQLCKRYFL